MAISRSKIAEQWRDADGYWIALKSGWKDGDDPLGACHTIVENTRREAFSHRALPCDCRDCRADKDKAHAQ